MIGNKELPRSTVIHHRGLTNRDLEYMASTKLLSDERERKYKRTVPWLFWPTELYSFGRCYREWLGWPRWLPIPSYGDHGVALSGTADQHETDNPARIYLTWSKHRENIFDHTSNKQVFRILHPWINYRRSMNISQTDRPTGTIVFHAHSNAGIDIVDYDFASYFEQLRALPEDYHPIVICLHMHDINKGYHTELRHYGFQIVTAGNTSSPFFVDRFYEMIRSFRYATSNKPGSELFYCEELGVRYFVYGQEPLLINRSHSQVPLGPHVPREASHIERKDRMHRLFSQFPPKQTQEKNSFVEEIIGLEVDSEVMRRRLRRAFFVEMVRLAPYYVWKTLRVYSKAFDNRVLRVVARKRPRHLPLEEK